MNYRKIGKTDIKVSEISLGCWTLGGPNWSEGNAIGWAEIDEAEVQEAVDYAIDHGVNHFDNADIYGNGKAERVLAKALGKKSKDVVIATKVGWFRGTADQYFEPAHVRHQVEQSLVNLKRDYIDIQYFHHADFGDNLEAAAAVLHDLKKEGKIRAIGQSAYSHESFQEVVAVVKPDVLQSMAHAKDTMIIDEGSPTRKLLDEMGMTFVAFSPLAQGVLLDKFKAGNPPVFEKGDNRDGKPAFGKEALELSNAQMTKIKERFGNTVEDMSRVALQYLLSFACVACPIPGFRNLKQVKASLAAAGKPLSGDEVAFVREVFSRKTQPA